MVPPEPKEGETYPVIFYNLGGVLMNFIVSLICGILFYITFNHSMWLSMFLLETAVAGIALGVTNAVPMKSSLLNNDGKNILALWNNPVAQWQLWLQLKANALQADGIRMRDMPQEWMKIPEDHELKDIFSTTVVVLHCAWLMDFHRFYAAQQKIEHYLSINTGMAGIHREMLRADYIFCEIMGACRRDVIEKWNNNKQKKFRRAMYMNPAILRTEYAIARILDKNKAKAVKIKKTLNSLEETYPYTGDLESELELVALVDKWKEESTNNLL